MVRVPAYHPRMDVHTLWNFLARAWGGVGPLLGVLMGFWLTRSWQRKQWLLESKKAEYRELIGTLSRSFHCMIKYWPYPEGHRVIADRIFIEKVMRAEKIKERWGLLAAEKDWNRLHEYWKDLHEVLVKAAHRDLG